MAKLTNMPALDIISGFKGTVDFFVTQGIPCARKWPRSPGPRRSTPVEAQWPAFSYAAKMWSHLPPEVRDAYRSIASASGLTPRDLFQRSYLSGILRRPPPQT